MRPAIALLSLFDLAVWSHGLLAHGPLGGWSLVPALFVAVSMAVFTAVVVEQVQERRA